MSDENQVRDVIDGITEEEVQALARAQKGMRDTLTEVIGADQVESRLRAFTAVAAMLTGMTGSPVEVVWYERPDLIQRCGADGKVRTRAVGMGRAH